MFTLGLVSVGSKAPKEHYVNSALQLLRAPRERFRERFVEWSAAVFTRRDIDLGRAKPRDSQIPRDASGDVWLSPDATETLALAGTLVGQVRAALPDTDQVTVAPRR